MLATMITLLEFIIVIILPCYVLYGVLEGVSWVWYNYDFLPRLERRLQEMKGEDDG